MYLYGHVLQLDGAWWIMMWIDDGRHGVVQIDEEWLAMYRCENTGVHRGDNSWLSCLEISCIALLSLLGKLVLQ